MTVLYTTCVLHRKMTRGAFQKTGLINSENHLELYSETGKSEFVVSAQLVRIGLISSNLSVCVGNGGEKPSSVEGR